MTHYIKLKGTCDTRNEFTTRKYVHERLVYEKVQKFTLSHQKLDRGDNTVGWHDTEQYTTSMRDFWHFLSLVYWVSAIFLPIFSIFQCNPPLMYAVKLVLHTVKNHTEHLITLK